nr:MAG TPA: Protein of unknown function (DUF1056) [Caudoviricetes sp.]
MKIMTKIAKFLKKYLDTILIYLLLPLIILMCSDEGKKLIPTLLVLEVVWVIFGYISEIILRAYIQEKDKKNNSKIYLYAYIFMWIICILISIIIRKVMG